MLNLDKKINSKEDFDEHFNKLWEYMQERFGEHSANIKIEHYIRQIYLTKEFWKRRKMNNRKLSHLIILIRNESERTNTFFMKKTSNYYY